MPGKNGLWTDQMKYKKMLKFEEVQVSKEIRSYLVPLILVAPLQCKKLNRQFLWTEHSVQMGCFYQTNMFMLLKDANTLTKLVSLVYR